MKGSFLTVLVALLVVSTTHAQPSAPALPDDGAWVLGLAGQADDHSSRSALALVDWGVTSTTWLSFTVGRSRSPVERADVTADTYGVGFDRRFGGVGFTLNAEHWGDPDALETDDLGGSVYFSRERWRVGLEYTTRDISIPFTIVGPLGNTLERTATVGADAVSVYARASVGTSWNLYFHVAEHDYERDLTLLPRIDRLSLLSVSTLTLANSFVDSEASIGVERALGSTLLTFNFATDRSAIDDTSFDTIDAAVLFPVAKRMDLEITVGHGRAELTTGGWYGGVMLLIYGR